MVKVADRKIGGLYTYDGMAYICLLISSAPGEYAASFLRVMKKGMRQTWGGWYSLKPAKIFPFDRSQKKRIVKFLFSKEMEW